MLISNSQINITEKNNQFIYSPDNGTTWIKISIDPGAYEVENISKEIVRQMVLSKHVDNKGDQYIKIDVILQTFKSYSLIHQQ